jgi:group I intron endonuclease
LKNIVNDKPYIGWTSRSIIQRFKEHIWESKRTRFNTKIYNAIKKYGFEKFYIKSIYQTNDLEISYLAEQQFIHIFDSYKNGYNMTLGGEGGYALGHKHSEKTRKNMSFAKTGLKNPNFNNPLVANHLNINASCIKCHKTTSIGNIIRWHYTRCYS